MNFGKNNLEDDYFYQEIYSLDILAILLMLKLLKL